MSWFADLESFVVGIVDAEDVGPGWEMIIVALVIFVIPLCVYGLVTFYDEARLIRKRSLVAEGIVQESKLGEKVGDYTTVYNVSITYQFTAEGKVATNTDTLSDMWSNDLGEHQRRLEQYPPGAKIPIHYEPGNPDNYDFQKSDARPNTWLLIPLIFSGGCFVLFSWLSGFFLTMYLKNFPSLSSDRQIITGSILIAIFIVFFFYTRWLYLRGFAKAGQKMNLLES